MALADVLHRHRFVVAAIAGSVIGAVIGLFLPIRAADPPQAEEASWSLPNAVALKRYRVEQFQAVRRARFWGELAMPGRRAANQPSVWSLHAIVTHPIVQVAVGTTGKPGQTWVRVGGALPDGATLVAVSRDRVWFEKEGCRRVRPLYMDTTKPDAEACIGAPAGDDAMASPKPPASSAPPAPATAAGKPH
ncbi:MAG TPA: hypothetical protein VLC71_12130 [Thermomonas sp.]|nr:hypothetical protein [Thermomonas sp.]